MTDVFYFDKKDWTTVPNSFSKSIVQGKRYYTEEQEGQQLFVQVQERLQGKNSQQMIFEQRFGQGAFRGVVTDVYQRRLSACRNYKCRLLQLFRNNR